MQANPATANNNQVKRPSQQLQQQQQDRPLSRQSQLYNLPTSINITAPSPMGSTRDVSRQQLASPPEEQLFTTMGGSVASVGVGIGVGSGGSGVAPLASGRAGSPQSKRHSHQEVLACDQLIGKTGQMSLGPSPGSSRRSIASCLPADQTYRQQQQQQPVMSQRAGPRHYDSSDNLIKIGAVNTASVSASHSPRYQENDDGGEPAPPHDDESRSKLIDELLKTINDDSFNEFIDFNNKLIASTKTTGSTSSQPDQMDSGSVSGGGGQQLADMVNANRPKSALGGGDGATRYSSAGSGSGATGRPARTLNPSGSGATSSTGQASRASGGARGGPNQRGSICVTPSGNQQQPSTFDNVIRRMSTNFVQNFNKMSAGTLGTATNDASGGGAQSCANSGDLSSMNAAQAAALRREKSSTGAPATTSYSNSLYVDNQIPARRHSDNTINVPRIQVALSSPSSSGSRTNLNQRASLSASKLATKWKMSAKSNQREASDKLSPNLGGALGYIRRHSSGNTQGDNEKGSGGGGSSKTSNSHGGHGHDQGQSNGLGAQLLNASPFKTRSNSNLGIDFLMSNRSMKRRYSAASMLGHQTQRKAENLIDAGMKSVQNMFS